MKKARKTMALLLSVVLLLGLVAFPVTAQSANALDKFGFDVDETLGLIKNVFPNVPVWALKANFGSGAKIYEGAFNFDDTTGIISHAETAQEAADNAVVHSGYVLKTGSKSYKIAVRGELNENDKFPRFGSYWSNPNVLQVWSVTAGSSDYSWLYWNILLSVDRYNLGSTDIITRNIAESPYVYALFDADNDGVLDFTDMLWADYLASTFPENDPHLAALGGTKHPYDIIAENDFNDLFEASISLIPPRLNLIIKYPMKFYGSEGEPLSATAIFDTNMSFLNIAILGFEFDGQLYTSDWLS